MVRKISTYKVYCVLYRGTVTTPNKSTKLSKNDHTERTTKMSKKSKGFCSENHAIMKNSPVFVHYHV